MSLTNSIEIENSSLGIPALAAGIVLQCDVRGTSSPAREGRAAAIALARAGLPLRLAPTDAPQPAQRDFRQSAQDDLESLQHRRLDLARSVLYYADAPPRWNLDVRGRARIGRASFGADRLPLQWIEPCRAMDEVWVPSEFHRQSFADGGIPAKNLRVMPSGVDTKLFCPSAPRLEIPGAKKFNFLAVTNLHDRQASEILLEAFLHEFHADEDVALWLKIAPHREPEPADLLAELAFFIERGCGLPLDRCPSILVIEEHVSPAAMASLYASADAFVRPAHGSQYAGAVMEALASGLPVIATRWGAPLDFLGDENSYLMEVERLVPAALGREFVVGHQWAQPSREHLKQSMRKVFTDRAGARERGLRGRRHMVERRDWNVVLSHWERAFREHLS